MFIESIPRSKCDTRMVPLLHWDRMFTELSKKG